MMNYWQQLKPRERIVLALLAIVVGIVLLYVAVLEPFQMKVEQLESRVAKQQADIQWMRSAAEEVKQLQRSNVGSNRNLRNGQSLLVLVDRTAKQNKLASSMKRVEPDGTTRVRVWLEKAAFDDVTRWLVKLQNDYQLEVESVVFDKTEDEGLVNVRLVFLGTEA